MLTKRIGVTAGKNLSYQKHFYRSEIWTIIKGEGQFALNDEIRQVDPEMFYKSKLVISMA